MALQISHAVFLPTHSLSFCWDKDHFFTASRARTTGRTCAPSRVRVSPQIRCGRGMQDLWYMKMTTVVARKIMRGLHVSPSRRVWFMAPLTRVLVAVGARAGRYAWGRMSKERKQAVKSAFLKRSGYMVGGIGGATACAIGYYVYHIEEAPVTGRNRFMMVNRQKLLEMIAHEKEAILHSLTLGKTPLPPSHASYNQAVPIIKRILPVVLQLNQEIQDVKWTVIILDSPDVVNAVCLPSGEIFIHSGLLQACHSDDELAFILAHEVAHVLMNHGGEIFSNKGVLDFFLLFGTAALWFLIPNDLVSYVLHKWSSSLADVLFHLPYSRQIEEEADLVGLMLLSSACYEPHKSIEVWTHLPSAPSVEYLSTHPMHEDRLESLKGYLPHAKVVWESSRCHKMEAESADFKNMVNKTLKRFFNFKT